MFTVVIPAFNEELSLKNDNFIDILQTEIDKSKLGDCEIIIVNDGSTDETLKILNENYKSDKIKILDNYINKGYGSSIKRAIMESKFDVIAIVDIDGQYPAKDVVEAIKKYFHHKVHNIDMIIARRTGPNYSGSIIKSFLRFVLQYMVEWTTGTKIPDINSGLRVFSKETIIPFFPRLSNHFSFTTTSTLTYLLTNKSIVYFPLVYSDRKGENNITKVRTFRDTLRIFQQIIETTLYYNPFKFFLLLSVILFLFSIICLIIFYFLKIEIFKMIFSIFLLVSLVSILLGFSSLKSKK
tara:strand:+ start:1205 stop:2092 length:888 start_codon:yes stop_codon:yes gene_type:complete